MAAFQTDEDRQVYLQFLAEEADRCELVAKAVQKIEGHVSGCRDSTTSRSISWLAGRVLRKERT